MKKWYKSGKLWNIVINISALGVWIVLTIRDILRYDPWWGIMIDGLFIITALLLVVLNAFYIKMKGW